ncbi:hypothetical protein GCM10010524_17500 [Streptomyces mexicanus]
MEGSALSPTVLAGVETFSAWFTGFSGRVDGGQHERTTRTGVYGAPVAVLGEAPSRRHRPYSASMSAGVTWVSVFPPIQYRPDLVDGCPTGTGLIMDG